MEDKFKRIEDVCEKAYRKFIEHDVPDIFIKSRKKEIVIYRQLFQTILRKKHNARYIDIKNFFEGYGYSINHATVINGEHRTLHTNYYSFPKIADIYDCYFNDKKEERIAKIIRKENSQSKNNLIELVNSIPKSKEDEIYQLVLLRMRSWEWKIEDNCKLYTGQSQINR